ncbi:MAG: hypothetical protein V4726_07655 [Verrucomicrobiota bacterium]
MKESKTEVEQDDTFKVFPDAAGKAYFPENKESYYTRYLAAMKEPSLQPELPKGTDRIFRFTYLRSFHDPLVVRISDTDGVLMARAVRLKKNPDYRPGKILHDRTWTLDAESTKVFLKLRETKDFWKPLNPSEEALASGGLDGSRWIFEMHDKDGYRMMNLWSPDVLNATDEQLKNAGIDGSKLRNFLVYKDAGNKILEIGQIMPEPENRY